MRPENVGLVRRSWERLAGREDRVDARFYERLFELAPGLEEGVYRDRRPHAAGGAPAGCDGEGRG